MSRSYIYLLFLIHTIAECVPRNNNWQSDSNSPQLLFSNVCQSGIREDNTNYIYCARKSLTSVPIFSKNNVVYDELVLADNRITELKADSFSRIKVKKIFLNGNPLRHIDQMTFRKLENHLEELWIDGDTTISSNNLLAEPLYTANGGLPRAIVDYLRNLNTLRIKGFMVHTLTNGIIKKLRRIEILSLKFCSIQRIEPFAFEGLEKSLKELYLDGNLMQEIPSDALFSIKLKSLRVLSLSQNRIKIIDQNSFGSYLLPENNLASLNKLDLSYNGLKEINENAFTSLNTSLEILRMQNNEINSFNLNFINKLTSLRELNLAFNVITSLHRNTFMRSNHLEVLELQGNSIKFRKHSSELDGLTRLERLNLARNNIKDLPAKLFKPVSSLQGLSLDKNPISNFNLVTFEGLFHNLKNLSLHNTGLKSNDLVSLIKFRGLERLKLSSNQIDTLDWKIFDQSHLTLTNLDARKNQIEYIHHSACDQPEPTPSCESKMEKLIELDLSSNKLCSFNTNLLSRMPHLKNLGLSHNPLYCDCNLLPLYEWSRMNFDKDIISFIQWQCEVPTENNEHVTHRQFTSLTSDEFKCSNGTTSKCQPPVQFRRPVTPSIIKKSSAIPDVKNAKATFLKAATELVPSRITNVELEANLNTILIKWSIDLDSLTLANKAHLSGFKISFNQPDFDLKSFTVGAEQRNFKLQNLEFNTKYSVCLSIIQMQGYDKYCKDIITPMPEKAKIVQLPTKSDSLSTASMSTSDLLTNSSGLIPSLMIITVCILILFIVGLLVFIYFYVRKCRSNKKKRSKSLMLSSSSSNTATINSKRPNGYQGPTQMFETSKKMIDIKKGGTANSQQAPSSTSSSSPQSTSTNSNSHICSCLQINSNTGQQICRTMGRQSTNGDTSTVSSTLSNENNKKFNPNYNNVQYTQEMDNYNKELYNRELIRTDQISQPIDLISSSPTSFQHFTLANNKHINYVPLDVYNQNLNSTLINQLNANNNNSTIYYDKLTKLNKIILNNNNEHVYCEIPSNMGPTLSRANDRNPQQLAYNQNQANLYNYNNNLQSLHQHLVNQSLLMATSSNQQSNTFQNCTNQVNNNNKSAASII